MLSPPARRRSCLTCLAHSMHCPYAGRSTWLERRSSFTDNCQLLDCFVQQLWERLEGVRLDILPMAFARGFLSSLRGLPASSGVARCGFGRTGSYTLSTGIDRKSCGMDVVCSVEVPVMVPLALGTGPFTHGKVKGFEHMPTVETPLAGWVPLVNLDKGSTIPCGFVL